MSLEMSLCVETGQNVDIYIYFRMLFGGFKSVCRYNLNTLKRSLYTKLMIAALQNQDLGTYPEPYKSRMKTLPSFPQIFLHKNV